METYEDKMDVFRTSCCICCRHATSMMAIKSQDIEPVDIVAVNQAVKLIESHWDDVEAGDYRAIALPFIILDQSGSVLYQTDHRFATTIYDAIRNQDIIVDIEHNNDTVGKLIIHNEDKDIVQQLKQQLKLMLIIAFSVMLILC